MSRACHHRKGGERHHGRYHGDGQSIVGPLLIRIILTRVGDECASLSQSQVQFNYFRTCDTLINISLVFYRQTFVSFQPRWIMTVFSWVPVTCQCVVWWGLKEEERRVKNDIMGWHFSLRWPNCASTLRPHIYWIAIVVLVCCQDSGYCSSQAGVCFAFSYFTTILCCFCIV